MTRPAKTEENAALTEILYQAAAEPIGLLIQSNDPERLRRRLWRLRDLAEDPTLENLQICPSPLADGPLVIVKVSREGKEGAQTPAPQTPLDLLDI